MKRHLKVHDVHEQRVAWSASLSSQWTELSFRSVRSGHLPSCSVASRFRFTRVSCRVANYRASENSERQYDSKRDRRIEKWFEVTGFPFPSSFRSTPTHARGNSTTRNRDRDAPRVGEGEAAISERLRYFLFHGMSEGEALSQKKQQQQPFHPQQQQSPIGSGPMANMAWQYPPNNMHNMFPSYPGWVASLEYRCVAWDNGVGHFEYMKISRKSDLCPPESDFRNCDRGARDIRSCFKFGVGIRWCSLQWRSEKFNTSVYV